MKKSNDYANMLLSVEDIVQVACPTCSATVGSPCDMGDNKRSKNHSARLRAARAQRAARARARVA